MFHLLTICSRISNENAVRHFYPLLPWQRDNIATNKWCQVFFYLSKSMTLLSIKKIHYYAWPHIFDSDIELILINSTKELYAGCAFLHPTIKILWIALKRRLKIAKIISKIRMYKIITPVHHNEEMTS